MSTLQAAIAAPPSVRAEFEDFTAFTPDPRDEAWVLGHELGLEGIDARPDPDLTIEEAEAFRRGYTAGLEAGGWSLDLMFLAEPGLAWHESELVRAVGCVEARRGGGL
jgi:hypothetical protein